MHVSGFTFVKNAVKLHYPVREAILSVLPLCDDFYVAVGDCNDGTREMIQSIDPQKIKIIDTVWNKDLFVNGAVYADETNKAYAAIPDKADWCFYIQGDEVVHEKYIDTVREAMIKYKDDQRVDGLLFRYLHFFGSYDFIGVDSAWYRYEIRVIRKRKGIYSYRDAQGFRKDDNQKLRVIPIEAYIYHYGWVRQPEAMQMKSLHMDAYYTNKDVEQAEKVYSGPFDYKKIAALKKFEGTHPKVMQELIAAKNWKFEKDPSVNRFTMKDIFKDTVEKLTGYRPFEYKNYKIIK
jgi:hypothetical protein